ncbi:MAG TPA: hypothetical protein VK139_03825 [Microbacteriaceae bacterium]|nr:hypothetical protein [Microbacteriaceae bacterium]
MSNIESTSARGIWTGKTRPGLSARGWTNIGMVVQFSILPVALWWLLSQGPLETFRQRSYSTFPVIAVIVVALRSCILGRIKAERELGYTTVSKQITLPGIDPSTRLIIRAAGQPDPSRREWRNIKATIRELKREQGHR